MNTRTNITFGFFVMLALALPTFVSAQSQQLNERPVHRHRWYECRGGRQGFSPKRGFSPYAGRNYPTRVFSGDQHVHTGWSVDAGAFGASTRALRRPCALPVASRSCRPSASRRS